MPESLLEGDAIEFHRAEDAEERGEGVCRTCLAPIWFEVGEIGHRQRKDPDWSDRIKRGGDSLVCFRAVQYRHVPLAGREAGIYDAAYKRGFAAAGAGKSVSDFAGWHEFIGDVDDASMCICGVPALSHDVVYPPAGPEVEHRLMSPPHPWRCTCGWEPALGESVWRAFDKHLLDMSTSSSAESHPLTIAEAANGSNPDLNPGGDPT